MIELIILGGLAALLGKGLSGSSSSSATPSQLPVTTRAGDFEFEHRHVNGEWRPYIRRQPGYRGRPEDLHSTHRYRDGDEHYVCWSEPIETRQDSEAIARYWAQKTQRYIEAGEDF